MTKKREPDQNISNMVTKERNLTFSSTVASYPQQKKLYVIIQWWRDPLFLDQTKALETTPLI